MKYVYLKLKVPFYNCDVYVNVVGGLNLDTTSGDLGRKKIINKNTNIIGTESLKDVLSKVF